MRWDPRKQYDKLLNLAYDVIRATRAYGEFESIPFQLSRGVIELIEQIENDEKAVHAALQECGGHLTLSTLVVYYNSMKKRLEELEGAK